MLTSQPCARELGPLERPMRFLLASLQPPRVIIIQKFGSTVFFLTSGYLFPPSSLCLSHPIYRMGTVTR